MGSTWALGEQARAAAAAAVAAESSEREASLRSRLAVLLVLNLVDGLFTLVFLQLHLAEEANPLMRAAYSGHPVLFLTLKLALVHTGALLLWANRTCTAARAALAGGLGLYAAIVAYHCSFTAWLLMGAR